MNLRTVSLLTIEISINECGKGSSTKMLKTSFYEEPFDDTQINSFDFSVVDSIFYVIIFEVDWSFFSLLFKNKKTTGPFFRIPRSKHHHTRRQDGERDRRTKERKYINSDNN